MSGLSLSTMWELNHLILWHSRFIVPHFIDGHTGHGYFYTKINFEEPLSDRWCREGWGEAERKATGHQEHVTIIFLPHLQFLPRFFCIYWGNTIKDKIFCHPRKPLQKSTRKRKSFYFWIWWLRVRGHPLKRLQRQEEIPPSSKGRQIKALTYVQYALELVWPALSANCLYPKD